MESPQSSSLIAQTAIHGGYETKDRLNYLLWQCGKARLAGDGHALHRYLSQLYLETITLMRSKNMEGVQKTLNKATEEYNKLCVNNKQLRKEETMSQSLYSALFLLEMELREKTANHVMPNKGDPGTAINDF